VVLGVDGIADFNALHSRKHDHEVQLYAFDILALDGEDLRALPLSMRKTNLDRLLARRPDGIFVAPFEQGEIGPDLFRAACNMGLEGLVSKRRDRPYRAGRSRDWVKVKNRSHPAMERVLGQDQVAARPGPQKKSLASFPVHFPSEGFGSRCSFTATISSFMLLHECFQPQRHPSRGRPTLIFSGARLARVGPLGHGER
jgi:ATP-dependent DNA ligase